MSPSTVFLAKGLSKTYQVGAVAVHALREVDLELVVGDFDRPPAGLGDQFRLDVEVVTWEAPSVRQVPASALVRTAKGWAVFVVEDGRARRRAVTIGHQSPEATEIVVGVELGEVVVRHPGSEVVDGVRVKGGQ